MSETSTAPANLGHGNTSSSPITVLPRAIARVAGLIFRTVHFTAQYSKDAYLGSSLTVTPKLAVLRQGLRDRYTLIQSSIDFPVFHAAGEGLPPGFKVYRMRKGWLDGFFGWQSSSWTGRTAKKGNWKDVTPHVELKAFSQSGKIVYTGTDGTEVTPTRSFCKDAATYDLNAAAAEEGITNANTQHLDSVTHISVRVPLTTQDGFYRFVVTDARDRILVVSPEYTIHQSFTSVGILRGSSIPALPIQFVGYLIKKSIAGVVSGLLTAFYFTGGLPSNIAIRLFMWCYKNEVADAKSKALAFAREKGAIKPLDYLAWGVGGALPGGHNRLLEYEKEWDGRKGSWYVRDVQRSQYA
ncbi:hypothetical protein DRE_03991 [Drechslerella stenobrocha 248]|uniref:Uncharacterized protein n=1 Tax=Drechslerella stenobrocha 248 TaxID=1043628 RepID=W7HRR4_9PEZI|nr:hypothetical protein DRE_03991 [Drechslerella stenobrocha 248]